MADETTDASDKVPLPSAEDKERLAAVLARCEERLRRIVRVRLNSDLRGALDSEDLVQDVFTTAWRQAGHLHLDSSRDALAWMTKVATHRIIDTYRRMHGGKRDVDRVEALPSGSVLAGSAAGPSVEAAREELQQRVDEAVAALPSIWREVVVLRSYGGLEWDEVARRLGVPSADAARQLHRRARLRLARDLRGLA